MTYSRAVVVALLSAVVAACATAAGTRPPRVDGNLVARAEISKSNAKTAYEIVTQLRPAWLVSRAGSMFVRKPFLYVDGIPRGNVDNLRDFPVEVVEEIRYLDPATAEIRWGELHPAGAIELKTLGKKSDDDSSSL